ncbi:MAG TPA: CehA/McbA family metallohydrolase [Bryobacteraceae bacterium]|nr:CehA/McbA family metallohydrolase [Bryobacteraceae bacterium]
MTLMMRACMVAALSVTAIPVTWAGQVDLTILDAQTGHAIPARVLVADQRGKSYVPDGAVEVPIGPDHWFVANGAVRLDIPTGTALVRVEHGTEYHPFSRSVSVPAKLTIRLDRWIDMRQRDYSSGEEHIHVPVSELPAMIAAEGLDFGSSLYWWNGPRWKAPVGPDGIRRLTFGKEVIPSSVFDTEVEHSWGAVFLIGLRKPITLPEDRSRSNLPFVEEARRQGALIAYQGGYLREVLVDALLGDVDVVDVCNNNFQRYKFQPRPQYSNMLDIPGFPAYPTTAEGMMQLNTDTYYRLLNCGLHLAAGAGSATGAKTTPVGYNRSYVSAGRNPTLPEFLNAWRQGRNFVTNGPMIFLTANGSHQPGDIIAFPKAGGELHVKATAVSGLPLRALEIVVNGKVAARTEGKELTAVIPIKEGTWIAARATAEDNGLSDAELARYRSQTKMGGEEPTRLRFGHTSPIYCTVGGAGARVPASIDEARRILNAFESYARKTAAPAYLPEILEALSRARAKLER